MEEGKDSTFNKSWPASWPYNWTGHFFNPVEFAISILVTFVVSKSL